MKTPRQKLVSYLNDLLRIESIKDISRNGLQCEGKKEISKIGLAVDACMKVYEKAVKEKCDMVLVHHGIIWGGLPGISGPIQKQLKFLLKHDLNLYAAHLPLDLHPEFGNNIQLAHILKLKNIEAFGIYDGINIGYCGDLSNEKSIEEIAKVFQKHIGGHPSFLPFGKEKIKSVAIVSGAASETLHEAVQKNIDCLITGESSHQDHHAALEGNTNVIYLGHYHSEKPGVISLGKHIEQKFGIETVFLDEPTLV